MADHPARKTRGPRRRPVPVTPEMTEGAPEFAPVPRRHERFDGWTYPRQRAFVKKLAETGGVRRAADHVGMSEVGAYQLRKAAGAEEFCRAWDEALKIGVSRLSDIAFDRAVNGVPVPIVYKGEIVGEKRVFNDRLLTWQLRHHDPERYGDARGDGVSPIARKRIRAEAQAEIDALGQEVALLRGFIGNEIERWEVQAHLTDKFCEMNRRMRGEPAPPFGAPRPGDGSRDHAKRLRAEYKAQCPPAPGPGQPPVPVPVNEAELPAPPEDWIADASEEPLLPGLIDAPEEREGFRLW